MKSFLKKHQIKDVPPGACTGIDYWILAPKGLELASYIPATGQLIGKIVQVTSKAYEKVVTAAREACMKWRSLLAPKRGAVVRDLGNALRARIRLGRLEGVHAAADEYDQLVTRFSPGPGD